MRQDLIDRFKNEVLTKLTMKDIEESDPMEMMVFGFLMGAGMTWEEATRSDEFWHILDIKE